MQILVGVSGSANADEAARQAALLQEPEGMLTLLSAWEAVPVPGGTGGDEELQRTAAERALAATRDSVERYAAATTKLVRGSPAETLLTEIGRDEDTLVAVGAGGLGRSLEIAEASVATRIVHRAPCSVLVARRAPDVFPCRVAVGIDGSLESAAAAAAARYLAARFGASLRVLVAHGGKGVDERGVAATASGDQEETALPPAEALLRAAAEADLLVTGNRGLHGLRALGSVAERAAHDAACSVLVVRAPGRTRTVEEVEH